MHRIKFYVIADYRIPLGSPTENQAITIKSSRFFSLKKVK